MSITPLITANWADGWGKGGFGPQVHSYGYFFDDLDCRAIGPDLRQARLQGRDPSMRQLSSAGEQAINDIAVRHGFSSNAVLSMLESVIHGNGNMAQFSHPEFSGSGQWMRGGMIMVSDMFNNALKSRIEGLCVELSNLIANQPNLIQRGSFQSQSQGGQAQGSNPGQQQRQHGSTQQQGVSGPVGPVSLFVPPAPGASDGWWPGDLHGPTSTGAQNGARYAYFAQARRLAIEVNRGVTVYDTLDHQIGGFSQQQSVGGSLSFSSQHGLIDVASLPVVSSEGVGRTTAASVSFGPRAVPHGHVDAPATAHESVQSSDVFATIEKLADLHKKGVLSDEEFASKKAELLGRL